MKNKTLSQIKSERTRLSNELKRNSYIEQFDDTPQNKIYSLKDEESGELLSCGIFLDKYYPELINGIFCNWLDQWAASYWIRHMRRREIRIGGDNDNDWDFGTRVYPVKILELLCQFKINPNVQNKQEITPAAKARDILNGDIDRLIQILSSELKTDDPLSFLTDKAKKLAKTKGGWFKEEDKVIQWLINVTIKESVPGTLEYELKKNREK